MITFWACGHVWGEVERASEVQRQTEGMKEHRDSNETDEVTRRARAPALEV